MSTLAIFDQDERGEDNVVDVEAVKKASEKDKALSEAKKSLSNGRWDKANVYFPERHRLSLQEGVILYDGRVVIPPSLRTTSLQIGHEGHQGINRTIDRLRELVWWPRMRRDAELWCKKCVTCQYVGDPIAPTPLVPSPLPPPPMHGTRWPLTSKGQYCRVSGSWC